MFNGQNTFVPAFFSENWTKAKFHENYLCILQNSFWEALHFVSFILFVYLFICLFVFLFCFVDFQSEECCYSEGQYRWCVVNLWEAFWDCIDSRPFSGAIRIWKFQRWCGSTKGCRNTAAGHWESETSSEIQMRFFRLLSLTRFFRSFTILQNFLFQDSL